MTIGLDLFRCIWSPARRPLAGILAGLLYATAFLRRGRIGDAVVAHALTNAMLAAWVLWTGSWYLW